jgi:hypothetical protein
VRNSSSGWSPVLLPEYVDSTHSPGAVVFAQMINMLSDLFVRPPALNFGESTHAQIFAGFPLQVE